MIKRVVIAILPLVAAFPVEAQQAPLGLKSEVMIEQLTFWAKGEQEDVYKAVKELSDCSGYFSAFHDFQLKVSPSNKDALDGLSTMKKDTAVVAKLIWSMHSTDPFEDVGYLTKEAAGKYVLRINEARGVDNISFLQRYDECSQAFLFSQFTMSMAQDELRAQKARR